MAQEEEDAETQLQGCWRCPKHSRAAERRDLFGTREVLQRLNVNLMQIQESSYKWVAKRLCRRPAAPEGGLQLLRGMGCGGLGFSEGKRARDGAVDTLDCHLDSLIWLCNTG